MNPKPLPTTNKVRLPSARVPAELIERIWKLLKERGDWTAFVIVALTREVERREAMQKTE